MSLLTSDLLLQAVAAVLALLGLLLALRTAVGDRPRGRARCPKCWYNMDALRAAAAAPSDAARPDAAAGPALRCPECGHVPRSNRHWFRTRRSRLGAALAVVLLLAAAGLAAAPTVRRDGPRALIPTALLLRLTDPTEWLDYHRGVSADVNPSWVNLELSLRIDTGRITPAGARAIARGAERAYERQNRLADPPLEALASETGLSESERAESWRFAAYDLAPVVFTRGFCGCGARPAHRDGSHDCPLRAQLCTTAMDIVQSLVDPMGWQSYGGTVSEAVLVGDQLLVYTDQRTHDVIARLLARMRSRSGQAGQIVAGDAETEIAAWNITDLLIGDASATVTLQRALALRDAIQSLIDSDSWLDYGGDEGALMYLNGGLIVAARHENQLAVAQLLTSIRSADAAVLYIEAAHPNAHVATHDLERLISGTGSKRLVEHSDSDWNWQEATRDERARAVAELIRSTVDPESWFEAGGEDSLLLTLDNRLIVSTSPDNHARIAKLLQQLAAESG